jgi:hypothetical protein
MHPKTKERTSLFQNTKVTGSPYNPEFVAKIERSRKNYKDGKGIVVTLKELKKLCK